MAEKSENIDRSESRVSLLIEESSPKQNDPHFSVSMQFFSALFYSVASILIMLVNKIVLTTYRFPSSNFVALMQMVFTIFALTVFKALGLVYFPNFDSSMFRKVFPLPLLYVLNLITGLGGTKKINLPMFTVLRRFSIWFTLLAESYILKRSSTRGVHVSVAVMIFGALVAASNDLAFDLGGYMFILLNDVFTAANGVYIKKRLDAKELNSFGLMYYNCIFSLPFMIVTCTLDADNTDEVMFFESWTDSRFQIFFLLSCIMGFLLTYSIYLCTQVNSALTTTVIGCLKNIIVSYAGMVFGGDYIFSLVNFLGVNVSILGSFMYAYVKYGEQKNKGPGGGLVIS